jgi:hypothetical protein
MDAVNSGDVIDASAHGAVALLTNIVNYLKQLTDRPDKYVSVKSHY